MTDLSITAANVLAGGNATIVHGVAGVALTAGQVVYLDKATGKWKLADSNATGAKVPGGLRAACRRRQPADRRADRGRYRHWRRPHRR